MNKTYAEAFFLLSVKKYQKHFSVQACRQRTACAFLYLWGTQAVRRGGPLQLAPRSLRGVPWVA